MHLIQRGASPPLILNTRGTYLQLSMLNCNVLFNGGRGGGVSRTDQTPKQNVSTGQASQRDYKEGQLTSRTLNTQRRSSLHQGAVRVIMMGFLYVSSGFRVITTPPERMGDL